MYYSLYSKFSSPLLSNLDTEVLKTTFCKKKHGFNECEKDNEEEKAV